MITKVSVTLTPKFQAMVPEVCVSVPGQQRCVKLWHTQSMHFEFESTQGWIEVAFHNKPADDAAMAVIVDSVSFFNITDPKFAWAGVYRPRYPEPWYSQQHNPPPSTLPQQTYMGWNGVWRLDFSVPVFTWMHQRLNLGWIYQ